jgi:hypothetical protein
MSSRSKINGRTATFTVDHYHGPPSGGQRVTG